MRPYSPSLYQLHIKPDLERLTFSGEVTITLSLGTAVERIELDALELDISDVTVTANGAVLDAEWTLRGEKLEIVPATPIQTDCTVTVHYTGEINDAMAGFYRSSYRLAGEVRYVGVTQFEERDARRAFPCIDEPAAKAPFRISVTAPVGTTAISNEAVEQTEPQPDGSKIFRFAQTPPVSTYLVFFAVGPFEITQDTSWRIPLRVAVSPGHGQFTQSALDYARQSISYLEEFTGVEYPLSKLDSIGVTDFAFGAMENFGAISYRENFLLDIPSTTTRREREKQMGIAAHEIAHMWFGDIVSPAAWRYVWLNEAFATYLGNVAADHWCPHWQTMDQFVITSQATAMGRDSYPNTIPIELDRDEIEIDSSTAPIIYQKGANMLRMLRAYYGDHAFRNACTAYLKTYQYSSASTEQFIKSFGQAISGASETNASAILESWVRRPGVPVLHVRRDGDTLHLHQERFLLTGDTVAGQPWVIPVTGRSSSGQPVRTVLDRESGSIDLPSGAQWVTLNSEQSGYYRVYYHDPSDWHALGQAASAGELSDLDRYGLIADLAAFVNSGHVTLEFYLTYLKRYFTGERSYVVIEEATGALLRFYELSDASPRVAAAGRQLLSPLAESLLAPPSEDEPYKNVLLRESVLWALARFGDQSVTRTLGALARSVADGTDVHPDMVPVAMRVWAFADDKALDWMEDQIRSPETPEGRQVALIGALSGAAREAAASRVLTFVLREVPYRNRLYFLRKAAIARGFREHLWKWFTDSFDEISGIHTYHLGATLMLCGAYGGLGREEEVQRFVADYRAGAPRVDTGVLDLTLDRLTANSTLMARMGVER